MITSLAEVPQERMRPGDLRVISARPDVAGPEHDHLLSVQERAARDRFHHEQDRRSSAASRVLLRTALLGALGTTDLTIDRLCHACGGPHGAPRVVGHPVQVSLSHTRGLVAVALHHGPPVGVDVEVVGPAFDDPGLVRQLLSEAAAGREWTREQLARDWTAKEAVLKASGHGLTKDLGEVDASAAREIPVPEGFAGFVAIACNPARSACV